MNSYPSNFQSFVLEKNKKTLVFSMTVYTVLKLRKRSGMIQTGNSQREAGGKVGRVHGDFALMVMF